MHKRALVSLVCAGAMTFGIAGVGRAQTFASGEPVLQQIWQQGMVNSQAYKFAQALIDSVGPRLTGSPEHKAGNEWLAAVYRSLGVEVRNEQYGTWKGWRRGTTHIDLLTPRVRSLEGLMLAWSPGTGGRAVEGPAIVLVDARSPQDFQQWLPQVRDKFVLISAPEPTCRPDTNWQQGTTPANYEKMLRDRAASDSLWSLRVQNTVTTANRELPRVLEQAGALGIINSNWVGGWGVSRVFNAQTRQVPSVQLSCEDYGLVYRLAENNDAPTLRLTAESQDLGEVPVFNTIATMRGSQLPNEYVMMSAHFDSWDASGGATDNATGTTVMLEAMRILKQVYPNPKRTILVGHWGGEEQGLNGSRAFAADHPEVVQGLQALFNQDNGTGRVANISMGGLAKAGDFFIRWHARLPKEISQQVNLNIPGRPAGGGSDHASFICHPYGAPAFGLSSVNFDYSAYTWHSNRDTFDKISFEDLKHNATLTAMVVYLASEEPEKIPRDRIDLAAAAAANPGRGGGGRGGRGGGPPTWPNCSEPQRNSTNYFR
ncbi:MAG: M20/M25/M40 family metallo-hydrolase [Longimicrobiales bacterium]